ncbi:MinD/ParA family ATP-binding protein [Rhodococcus sp. ADH]|uniref:MinD/ParA family ATP-binding protein n=1 Tax=Rhodococcus sp. ADH TaxID=224843 RepID=UPI000A8021AF|nr:MinD/ParA family protein [Rhodococcus sp. ADH]
MAKQPLPPPVVPPWMQQPTPAAETPTDTSGPQYQDLDAFISEVTSPIHFVEEVSQPYDATDEHPLVSDDESKAPTPGSPPSGKSALMMPTGVSPSAVWATSNAADVFSSHSSGEAKYRAASSSNETNWRVDRTHAIAESGWRRWLFFASAKTVNLGENPADIAHRELTRRLQRPIDADFKLGIVQLKGGAAKTTTAIGVGNAFAEVRTDAVLAVDVNPDRGNLARRTTSRTDGSVFTLLDAPRPQRVHEIRTHTNQTPAGLEILASAQDPATAQSFSAADYDQILDVVKDFYSLIIADCGTNITHPATQAVLAHSDALIIPLDAKQDSADEAVAAIDYLHSAYAKDPDTNLPVTDENGHRRWLYRHLLARTIVVVSHQRPGKRPFDVDKSLAWFQERVHEVHVIPYDPHLEESAEIFPDRLNPATTSAYRGLAAKVADLFPVHSRALTRVG